MHHDNLMYIDWSAREVHPKLLVTEDFAALQASQAHFARKFDLEKSADVLAALDRIIDGGADSEIAAASAIGARN